MIWRARQISRTAHSVALSRNRANAAISREGGGRSGENSEDQMMRIGIGAAVIAAALAGLLGGTPALAQPQDSSNQRLLSVSGEGIVHGAPDIALITLGVVSEAATARESLAANNQSMERILTALKQSGIESRDLQTSGFSVEPIYSQPPRDFDNSQPFVAEIVGYRVRNNIDLRIRDLSKVGSLLDQVVTLGANSISGPSFTVDDPKPLQDEARREAVADALRKGKLLADAAGIQLGQVFRIDEGYAQPPQPLAAGAMMRMEAAPSSVPIEGGELTFQAQVSVSWKLAD
jgi:uncharacterized protein YggE